MRRALLAVLLLALCAPASAPAAWFAATPVDGPNAAVIGLGGVDVARDGTGGLVYLRTDGVFLARLENGAWQAPQRIDTGIAGPPRAAKVAAADGGRLLVAWIDGGTAYAMQIPGPGSLGTAVTLGSGATSVEADLGVDAAGWVVWDGGGSVRAASARGGRWSALTAPMNLDAAHDAFAPQVAVGADGSGLMTWTETGADGRTHVAARRLTPRMSIPPADLTLAGGPAIDPDVDLEDDADFGWVVFSQNDHSYARRFLGSTFDPPVALDGGAASGPARVDFNGGGTGEAVLAGPGEAVLVSPLVRDTFRAPQRLDTRGSVVPPGPVTAASELRDEAVAWLTAAPGGVPAVHARYSVHGGAFQPETPLTSPALGGVGVGDYDIAADRVGDTAVAVAQGSDGARSVGAAVWDRPPAAPTAHTVRSFAAPGKPRFSWNPHPDLWGAQTFLVQVDGRTVGRTTRTSLVPARRLRGGRRRWRVVAVDRRGQTAPSATQVIRVAPARMTIGVRVSGSRRAGRRLRIVVRVHTRRGVHLDHVTVSYGDGTRSTRRASSTHVYRRRGAYRLTARAVDTAGRVVRDRVTLRIA